MIQTQYVSFEEFAKFRQITEEKIKENENKIDKIDGLVEIMISNDEKIENMAELMMDGFDMLRDKIEEYKS